MPPGTTAAEATSTMRNMEKIQLDYAMEQIANARGKTPHSWDARLLAVGLGLDPDPVKAASLVNLPIEGLDLEALKLEASSYRDLTERRPGAIGALLHVGIVLGAIRVAANMDLFPLAQIPQATRTLCGALELLQGSTMPAWTELKLIIRSPEGADIEIGKHNRVPVAGAFVS